MMTERECIATDCGFVRAYNSTGLNWNKLFTHPCCIVDHDEEMEVETRKHLLPVQVRVSTSTSTCSYR